MNGNGGNKLKLCHGCLMVEGCTIPEQIEGVLKIYGQAYGVQGTFNLEKCGKYSKPPLEVDVKSCPSGRCD